MRLFEAIMEANHRALAGDTSAGVRPDDFAESLPVAALTCIDARLNPLFPDTLGLPKEQFIWLRNAGNIITSPLSSTMRSLALACAVKGAREIAIIGHTDCQVCKTSAMKLTEAFKALGVERSGLPENLTEFFGLFASERQNVLKGVAFVRSSPMIGSKVPVHGLMVNIEAGKLEWVVNGYQEQNTVGMLKSEAGHLAEEGLDAMRSFAAFKIGEMKFPDTKIGEISSSAMNWLASEIKPVETHEIPEPKPPEPSKAPPVAPRIPYPPKFNPNRFKRR